MVGNSYTNFQLHQSHIIQDIAKNVHVFMDRQTNIQKYRHTDQQTFVFVEMRRFCWMHLKDWGYSANYYSTAMHK